MTHRWIPTIQCSAAPAAAPAGGCTTLGSALRAPLLRAWEIPCRANPLFPLLLLLGKVSEQAGGGGASGGRARAQDLCQGQGARSTLYCSAVYGVRALQHSAWERAEPCFQHDGAPCLLHVLHITAAPHRPTWQTTNGTQEILWRSYKFFSSFLCGAQASFDSSQLKVFTLDSKCITKVRHEGNSLI